MTALKLMDFDSRLLNEPNSEFSSTVGNLLVQRTPYERIFIGREDSTWNQKNSLSTNIYK